MSRFGLLSATTLLSLALQCAPALASKPGEPPGKATQPARQSAKSKPQQPTKVDARGGQSARQAAPARAGFAAANVRSRDDDRRDDHDRNARRGDDDRWNRDDRERDHDDDPDWDRDRHDWDRDRRDWDRDDDKRFYSYSGDNDRRYYYDRRIYDRHYYPRRGYIVPRLPYGYRVVRYYGAPYYFGGGSWYRPFGSSFTVVSPPIGLMVAFLPEVYTTLFIGGVPYYCANDVYYRWRPEHRAYVVTTLPPGFN